MKICIDNILHIKNVWLIVFFFVFFKCTFNVLSVWNITSMYMHFCIYILVYDTPLRIEKCYTDQPNERFPLDFLFLVLYSG